jgi:hypothetical protein
MLVVLSRFVTERRSLPRASLTPIRLLYLLCFWLAVRLAIGSDGDDYSS